MTSSTGNNLAYLRVSTVGQDLATQEKSLDDYERAHDIKIPKRNRYRDVGISGAKSERPGLIALMEEAEEGDVVYCYKLDRLGRNAAHLLTNLDTLDSRGVRVVAIADGIDTATLQGRIFAKLLGVLADIERTYIAERTRDGLAAAAEKGNYPGRPKVTDSAQARRAQALRDSGESVPDIARTLGVSIATVYRITKSPAKA